MKIKVGQLYSFAWASDKERMIMITEIHGHNVRFIMVDTGDPKITSKRAVLDGVRRNTLRLISKE